MHVVTTVPPVANSPVLTRRPATDMEEMTFLFNLCNICTAHLLNAFGNRVFLVLARVCVRACARPCETETETWYRGMFSTTPTWILSKVMIISLVSQETARDSRYWSGSLVGSHSTHWKRHSPERYHCFQTCFRIEEAVIPVSALCGPLIISQHLERTCRPWNDSELQKTTLKCHHHTAMLSLTCSPTLYSGPGFHSGYFQVINFYGLGWASCLFYKAFTPICKAC